MAVVYEVIQHLCESSHFSSNPWHYSYSAALVFREKKCYIYCVTSVCVPVAFVIIIKCTTSEEVAQIYKSKKRIGMFYTLVHCRNTPKRRWTAGRSSVSARTFESLLLAFLSPSTRETHWIPLFAPASRPETYITYHSRSV